MYIDNIGTDLTLTVTTSGGWNSTRVYSSSPLGRFCTSM